MRLTVNGEIKEFAAEKTVVGLLDHLGIDSATVVVEVNLEILKRAEHPERILAEGDSVEIIRMVDGG